MMTQSIILHVPESMYQRLQRMAQTIQQPLEEIVYQSIQGNLPPLVEDVPSEWYDDVAELHQLNNEALLMIAREPLPIQQWDRHQQLLERNQAGTLTDSGRKELEHLRTATDRFVFRRSYALALLKWRGHAILPETGIS